MVQKKNKIIIALLLVICLLFAGCSSGSNTSTDLEESTSKTDTSSQVSNDELNSEDGFIYQGQIAEVYKNSDANIRNKFLGSMLLYMRPEADRKTNLPVISVADEDADIVLRQLHLKEDWLEYFVLYTSKTSDNADTIVVIKPTENDDEYVMNALTERLTDMAYVGIAYEDQFEKVNGAFLQDVGGYLMLLICDNVDDTFNVMMTTMQSCNLADTRIVE